MSLISLQKVVRIDQAAVQKHKNTILDCLRESDISIKRHALTLLCEIVNESNVKSIVKEMLNYLLISETDFLQELTLKVNPRLIPSIYSFALDLLMCRKIFSKPPMAYRCYHQSIDSSRQICKGRKHQQPYPSYRCYP